MIHIHGLLDELLASGGSDLHLAAGQPPLVRRNGELSALIDAPIEADEIEELLFEILRPEDQARFSAELGLDFSYAYEDRGRFRASYFHKRTGLGAVFRAVPGRVLLLEELGCPEILKKTLDRRSGLVLVAGPGGSGKTTTLAAMVDHVNRSRACHVLTIEDPVEFVHTPVRAQVTHREVGPDARSFAAGLRSAAREDADVVVAGDLGEADAMRLALRMACSGTLVLGAVTTQGAAATIDRILNGFPADEQPQVRGMLAEALVAIVGQELLRAADGRGKIAAFEVLLGSTALAAMIREGKTTQVPSLMQAGAAVGMTTMDTALERLVQRGLITGDDAFERATDKEGFHKSIARRTGPRG
jgi:twitching motility protein PilT